MDRYAPTYFAQYGCGAYGQTSGYNSCDTAGTTTAASSENTAAAGTLPNTGAPIFISTGIAIALIVLAIIIFKKRKK